MNRLTEEETEEELDEEEAEYGEPFDVSLVAKALILFGLFVLVIYLALRFLAVTTYADDMWMDTTILGPGIFEGVIAITFIFVFFGLIAYLIHIQFMKLALIAEEVTGSGGMEGQFEEERVDFSLEDSG